MLRIAPEIKQALAECRPVVSLESTIITHGFPYPANIEMATQVEQKIRNSGAIPATCGFIKGVPYVGMLPAQLEFLAGQKNVNKVSRRDIGATVSGKLNGGTTIAGTMILSRMAGIDVFATGGLGGVHRDGHVTMDVSADLTELSRTPVSVVCAGPKLILDVQRTMEFLETHGVYVATLNDNGRPEVDIPGFFARDLGVPSEYTFQNWKEAADTAYAHNKLMGLSSACLFCVPPPELDALPSESINGIIETACAEATQLGISGKKLTPFLLKKVAEGTNGRSVECNKNFMLNNARAAVELATELRKLDGGPKSLLTPTPTQLNPVTPVTPAPDHVDTVYVGAVALDTISTISTETHLADSNPGSLRCSVGGVGHNVALAGHYSVGAGKSRLISAIGADLPGKAVLEQLTEKGQDISGVCVDENTKTAQYSAILHKDGLLAVAVADMGAFEQIEASKIAQQVVRAQPSTIVLDCNFPPATINEILAAKLPQKPAVVIEPTSVHKLARVAELNSAYLRAFPKNTISMITPTVSELETIHSSFSRRELFDDYDEWFPVLDSLGIFSQFREKLVAKSAKCPVLASILQSGVLQQSFQILPYIPTILVKLGSDGVLLVRLSTDVEAETDSEKFGPKWRFRSSGNTVNGKKMGVVVAYFPVPKKVDVVNVTGAGDTLLGTLSGDLSRANWLTDASVPDSQMWLLIYRAQQAAGLSVASEDAVPELLATGTTVTHPCI